MPYRHLGRGRTLDCIGLLHVAIRDALGVDRDYRDYAPTPTSAMTYRAIRRFARRIAPTDARAGDILLVHAAGVSTHFAIKTEAGMIHACRQTGRVVEHHGIAIGRIVAYYRLNELD